MSSLLTIQNALRNKTQFNPRSTPPQPNPHAQNPEPRYVFIFRSFFISESHNFRTTTVVTNKIISSVQSALQWKKLPHQIQPRLQSQNEIKFRVIITLTSLSLWSSQVFTLSRSSKDHFSIKVWWKKPWQRWCLQNKRAAETTTSPKPSNYRTPQKYLSPGSSVSKNRQILVDREKSNVALPPPRLLVKGRLFFVIDSHTVLVEFQI